MTSPFSIFENDPKMKETMELMSTLEGVNKGWDERLAQLQKETAAQRRRQQEAEARSRRLAKIAFGVGAAAIGGLLLWASTRKEEEYDIILVPKTEESED